MPKKPSSVTIFSYQVGFGDCFLAQFDYDDRPRYVLIDFGTTSLPEGAPKDQMERVAKDIAAKCGKNLVAVVATHRHADHISGFATKTGGKGTGDIIRALKPKVVIQPWTEQLDLKTDALGPGVVGSRKQLRGRRLSLNAMHATSERILQMLDDNAFSRLPKAVQAQMRFLGEDNLKNKSAVKNLSSMGNKQVYAFHGANSGLAAILPGVKIHVLGPPTLKQTDTIRKQRSKDPDEFWHLTLRRLAAAEQTLGNSTRLFGRHPTLRGSKLPLSMRWFANRLNAAQGDQTLAILRQLDQQMNNTSLILLFEIGKKKLLFPGDAQLENWQFALSKPKILNLLKGVDLYKVGHHGSLNATPRSMWSAFAKRGPKTKKGRLTTMMSTRKDKHGSEDKGTEVPRRTLVTALRTESELHSTHLMDGDALFGKVTVKV